MKLEGVIRIKRNCQVPSVCGEDEFTGVATLPSERPHNNKRLAKEADRKVAEALRRGKR